MEQKTDSQRIRELEEKIKSLMATVAALQEKISQWEGGK